MTTRKKGKTSISGGIPENLPSLSFAYCLTKRAARLGFDWPDLSGVLKKMDEEIGEFQEALALSDRRRIAEEFGDLLFVLVNVARFLRIDPEAALRGTIRKFNSRFLFVETSLQQKGKSLRQSNLEEMDRLWEEAKKRKKTRRQGKVKQ